MKKLIIITIGLIATLSAQASTINKPVLLPFGGKAASCIENAVRIHVSVPGENAKISEWKGPGVIADSGGAVDPSLAVYVFKISPSEKWYAMAFLSTDDNGWGLFSYQENDQLRIGYRAASMDSIAQLFGVNPRDPLAGGDDEVDTTEIDLAACAGLFTK